jgi:hypothetical protein
MIITFINDRKGIQHAGAVLVLVLCCAVLDSIVVGNQFKCVSVDFIRRLSISSRQASCFKKTCKHQSEHINPGQRRNINQ